MVGKQAFWKFIFQKKNILKKKIKKFQNR